jgi:GNAT superfamily N-acetyltransferase
MPAVMTYQQLADAAAAADVAVPTRPALAVVADPVVVPEAVVAVRPAGPGDTERARRFFDGLSLESSYRRFFTGIGRLPDRFIQRLVVVDHDRREAFVAVVGDDIVALADYALLAGCRDTAEFGVVVADGWQRRGLGPRLVTELLAVAESRGVTAVRAHTLAENGRVLKLLQRRWPAARPEREDTLLIWQLPLAPVGQQPRAAG